MRDMVILLIAGLAALVALKRPWVGVMLWTWISIMNPHRFSYGLAFNAPLAAMAAGSTLIGLFITRDRGSPFKGSPVVWLAVFVAWVSLSWLFGLDAEADYPQWSKVMKIYFMIFIGLALLSSKEHILALAWVAAGSLAVLGVKGGAFTLATGGNYRVWGPPDSFIADNNEFALSLIVTIPLLRFLQMQLMRGWQRYLLTAVMVLCAAAALGTHSRGGLLAIAAMTLVLWWRGRSRVMGGIVMVAAAVSLVTFMPDSWTDRMATMSGDYVEDRSALGRVSAWWNAFGIANHRILGVGFNAARS